MSPRGPGWMAREGGLGPGIMTLAPVLRDARTRGALCGTYLGRSGPQTP